MTCLLSLFSKINGSRPRYAHVTLDIKLNQITTLYNTQLPYNDHHRRIIRIYLWSRHD